MESKVLKKWLDEAMKEENKEALLVVSIQHDVRRVRKILVVNCADLQEGEYEWKVGDVIPCNGTPIDKVYMKRPVNAGVWVDEVRDVRLIHPTKTSAEILDFITPIRTKYNQNK